MLFRSVRIPDGAGNAADAEVTEWNLVQIRLPQQNCAPATHAGGNVRVQSWPIQGLSLTWFGKAAVNPGVRHALLTSLEIALCAAALAIVLGTLLALAVHRFAFFGRTALSFAVVLPIALPGIVTGMALNATFRTEVLGLRLELGLLTVIVGHATFCIVILFNNVIALMRRV